MEILESDIVQIEAYLGDQISLEEARGLVENFDGKLELYQQAQGAIEQWGDDSLKASLKAGYAPASSRPLWPGRNLRILSVAAAIVILAGIFFWLRPKTEDFDADRYFAQYYAKPDAPTALVRGSNDRDSLLSLATDHYESGNYKACLETISTLEKTEDDALALRAYSYMQLDNWEEAEASMLEISEAFPAFSEIKWYLALVSLKLDDIGKAREHLGYLKANSREYGPKAEELLEDLPKNQAL